MANTVGSHIVIGIAEANESASGEPDLAKRHALRVRVARILRRALSAVRIEAATRTVITWAVDGTTPEQYDLS